MPRNYHEHSQQLEYDNQVDIMEPVKKGKETWEQVVARALALAEAKGLGRELPTEWFLEDTRP